MVDSTASLLIPAIKLWRPYRRTDKENVDRLANANTWRLFGSFDMSEMLEISNHSLVMENDAEQIVACLCLRNYPNIPSVLPEVWPEVFARLYHLPDVNVENTLFIHMLVCDIRYNWNIVVNVIRSMYLCIYRLKFVVFVILPNCERASLLSPNILGKYFLKIHANGSIKHNAQMLYVTMRQKFLPQLKIRRAVPEDNDSLVSILDRTAPILKRRYGDFYVAEMLLAMPSEREIIVAETDNHESVGMMCFNQKVSMGNLASNYDTGAFHGFRKHTSNEYLHQSSIDITYETHTPAVTEMVNSEIEWGKVARPDAKWSNTRASVAVADDYVLRLMERNLTMSSDSSFSSETDIGDMEDRKVQPSTFNRTAQRVYEDRSNLVNIVKCAEFSTEADVFLIELFGMRGDIDDRMAYTLLECGFETYPKLSYCLITFPSNRRYFPLLNHFVRVIPRSVRTTNPRDMVYVVQRNALLSPIEVRFIDPSDEIRVRKFHEHMDQGKNHAEEVMTASRHSIQHPNSPKRVYSIIVMCETSMIGVCIVETDNQLEHYRLNYEIDNYIDPKHHSQQEKCCLLRMMVLQPAFMLRLPYILSEIFRKTGFTSMFYKLLDYNGNYSDYIVNTMLIEMIPIRPRIRMTYETNRLNDDQMPMPKIMKSNQEPSALYHTNVQACTKRKIPIHDRIVVVGCSTTALGFLEELFFSKESQNLLFVSLTVISPAGFSAKQLDLICPLSKTFTFSQKYTPQYMRQLSFHTWVNVVFSNVTDINRKAKYVVVEDHTHYYYDKLFLFCGLQFDYPIKLKAPQVTPKNVIFVNNNLEAESMLLKLAQLKRYKFYQIVVYGDYQQSYTCINMMMESGIHPEKITFIRPRSPSSVTTGKKSMFNENFVDDMMENLLDKSAIKVFNNYEIVDWIVNDENLVSRIFVESNLKVIDLDCSLMVCFERKIVRRKTIAVLNSAGLVFDGRLVIDAQFQTSDPCIFSAGPMTKYKRNMFACHMRHEHFNSSEIGTRVALKYLEQNNPNRPFSQKKPPSHTIPGTTHMFVRPKVTYRTLLDNYFYFCVTKPGRALPHELDKSTDDYGVDLITGNDIPIELQKWGADDVHYMRIRLDKHNRVHTIVSLTQKTIDVQRFIALWGQHESMLGNLRMRFETDRIPCLYEYFNLAWTHILYHDRYARELTPLNNSIMLNATPSCEMHFLDETINDIVENKYQRLSDKQRATLVERYFTSMYSEAIKTNLMNFLSDYKEELPMYYKPDVDTTRFSTG